MIQQWRARIDAFFLAIKQWLAQIGAFFLGLAYLVLLLALFGTYMFIGTEVLAWMARGFGFALDDSRLGRGLLAFMAIGLLLCIGKFYRFWKKYKATGRKDSNA